MSMDGRYSAKSQEGGAVMSMDGRADNCSLHFPHSPLPCGSYVAKSQEGGAVVFSNMVTEKCRLKMAYYCQVGFVYA